MPLRNIILQSRIHSEDADLLESLFNQFISQDDDAARRHKRAAGLVKLFAEGERDRDVMIQYLVGSNPKDGHRAPSVLCE